MKDEPATRALIDRAIAGLSESRLKWLEANLWLQVRLPDFAFEGTGTYVRAPGQRFRLEMRTHLVIPANTRDNQTGATILAISDGRDMWTAQRTGERWQNVKRLQMSSILNGPESPVSLPHARDVFLSGPALRGIEKLLRNLNDHFDWVKREQIGGDVRIIGRWRDWMLRSLARPNQPWAEALPRFCRLTLHGTGLWPARIEWWGPREENGPDRLLVEMEFRDPVFDHPVPEERCAGLFSFSPGTGEVEDLTPGIRAEMVELTKHLMMPRR
jgi:hypothetical protein